MTKLFLYSPGVQGVLLGLIKRIGKILALLLTLTGCVAVCIVGMRVFGVPRPGESALLRQLNLFKGSAETSMSLAVLRSRSGGMWSSLCVLGMGATQVSTPPGVSAFGFLFEAQDFTLLSEQAKIVGLWGPIPLVAPYVPVEASFLPRARTTNNIPCANVEQGILVKDNGIIYLEN